MLLAAAQGSTKKVLFFTKSSGFQHSVITRHGDKPGHAERILTEIGKEHGFEVVASKDGRLFEPDQIGQWDVVRVRDDRRPDHARDRQEPADLAPTAKRRFTTRSGAARASWACTARPTRSATSAQRNKGAEDPYIQMIGGEFITHGDQQDVRDRDRRPRFPGMAKGFGTSGQSFTITDEWYALKNMPEDLHVILVQVTEGMKGDNVPAAQLPDDLGAGLRQGARLLHLDGPPRRRLGEPDVPGAACSARLAGRPAASTPTSSPTSARSRPSTIELPR